MDTVAQRDDEQHEHHHHEHHHHHHHHESRHIVELEQTIKALTDALANQGRGTHLHELLRIVRGPGWTTPAELAFVNAILDSLAVQVRSLERLQADLVEAARKVRPSEDR